MARTQKDLDIARMSTLKSACELMSAFKDNVKVEGTDGVITTTLKVADKLLDWVLQPPAQSEEQETSYLDMLYKEAHELQKKLGIPLTDWNSQCPLTTSWAEGGVQELLDGLRKQVKSRSGRGRKSNGDTNGYTRESNWRTSEGPALSKKQFGYLMGLHRDLGIEPDKGYLNSLTSQQASGRIEELKAQLGDGGNGNRPNPY